MCLAYSSRLYLNRLVYMRQLQGKGHRYRQFCGLGQLIAILRMLSRLYKYLFIDNVSIGNWNCARICALEKGSEVYTVDCKEIELRGIAPEEANEAISPRHSGVTLGQASEIKI
jgi:hypothetical protein